MEDITLAQLLEAGCHFGHKSERWHPRASAYIYTEKDGIHIIDLAKTREGLLKTMEFVRDTVAAGGDILYVATKRQAQGIVREAAKSVNAPFFTNRWIGGFLTNWEEIKKNVTKANQMEGERTTGAWKKFPKHEQVKLGHHLDRLNMFYEGVLNITAQPKAFFIVDVRKEISAVREAKRCNIPVIGVVDTNSDPKDIDYVIPANDDAVGSIELITKAVTSAYAEGLKLRAAQELKKAETAAKQDIKTEGTKPEEIKTKPVAAKKTEKPEEKEEKPGTSAKKTEKPAKQAKKATKTTK